MNAVLEWDTYSAENTNKNNIKRDRKSERDREKSREM